jgi:hypothetical protein
MSETRSPVPGRYRLVGAEGAQLETADASFEAQGDSLVVQPREQPLLRVDFADVDAFETGDHVFALRLASGERVEASMLGRRFAELADATAGALTAYQARNMLLEEPVGGESFACDLARDGEETPAELRVFATSLAVIPRTKVPFSIPFGELASVSFDEARYAIDLATESGKLSLLRLGKKTQPCARLVEERLTGLRQRTAEALAFLVPQLPTLAARRFMQALPDGVPARREQLDALSPAIWPALVQASIAEPKLRVSFEALCARCPAGEIAVGIKETHARQDVEEEPEPSEAATAEAQPSDAASDGPAATEQAEGPMAARVVWFVFPLFDLDRQKPGNAVAVEAVTRTGRATYLFRIAPAQAYREASPEELTRLARERVRSVSRALVALTFKREPIYLPDEKIQTGPYARYRLALRLSVPLKASRASFIGRAIHGHGWARQVDAALARAMA